MRAVELEGAFAAVPGVCYQSGGVSDVHTRPAVVTFVTFTFGSGLSWDREVEVRSKIVAYKLVNFKQILILYSYFSKKYAEWVFSVIRLFGHDNEEYLEYHRSIHPYTGYTPPHSSG